MKPHTTHHACKEVLDRDGGKAVGCCCTGHECKSQQEQTRPPFCTCGTTRRQHQLGCERYSPTGPQQEGEEKWYRKGRQDILDEMAHEQRKLLDGFAHPKNCAECNQTKQ